MKGVVLKKVFEAERGDDTAHAFEGTAKMLSALRSDGLQLAVLSNKRDDSIHRSVIDCFTDVPWVTMHGSLAGVPIKPSPVAALRIIDDHMPGVSAKECAFVGDTTVDMRTGIAAGLLPVGVAWGFHSEEELVKNGAKVIARERVGVANILRAHRG